MVIVLHVRCVLLAVAALLSTPAIAVALPPDCEIQGVDVIRGNVQHPAFSPSGERFAYNATDQNGDNQLYTARPDGSDRHCLSCTPRLGAPPVKRHKIGVSWHPSGRFITVQVEVAGHPLGWVRRGAAQEYLFTNGLWSTTWATTPDGSRWWKLNDVTTKKEDGIFHTAFSPDGQRFVWGRLWHKAQEPDYPWGGYKMELGDFVVISGRPSLQNVRDITPPWGKLIEPGGIRGNRVLFGGNDPDNPPSSHLSTGDLDIWEMDLATDALRNLTRDDNWDEHPSWSPDGRLIAYLNVNKLDLMTADGSGSEPLALPLDPGEIPTSSDWSPDGRRLAVSIQTIWTLIPSNVSIKVLHFAGPCGSQ
jgi:dipeptidyl aminopeptidase/acylaminoacyl peptidase